MLGGTAGSPAAVPSRHRVSHYPEPGVQVLGGDVVLAVHAVGKLLQVLPLAWLQGGDLSEAQSGFPAGRSLSHPQFLGSSWPFRLIPTLG